MALVSLQAKATPSDYTRRQFSDARHKSVIYQSYWDRFLPVRTPGMVISVQSNANTLLRMSEEAQRSLRVRGTLDAVRKSRDLAQCKLFKLRPFQSLHSWVFLAFVFERREGLRLGCLCRWNLQECEVLPTV